AVGTEEWPTPEIGSFEIFRKPIRSGIASSGTKRCRPLVSFYGKRDRQARRYRSDKIPNAHARESGLAVIRDLQSLIQNKELLISNLSGLNYTTPGLGSQAQRDLSDGWRGALLIAFARLMPKMNRDEDVTAPSSSAQSFCSHFKSRCS